MANRTVSVGLKLEVAQWLAGSRQAVGAARQMKDEITAATKTDQGRQRLDELGMAAASTGAAMLAAFGVAVNAAAKFDKQMSEVAAVSDATGDELEKLRQAALRAGADTSFSATEAAKAQAELAKAGLSTAEILSGALSGALDLAAAGSLDLAEAAEIAAKTMNVFQLKGTDVGHIADVLAAAANKSATDVHEMGEALKQGGLAANAAGMSLEETVGTLAAFADRALAGSDAGTSLKTALMMLQAPTDKAAELMKELGINAYDASGNFVGTAALAGQLQKALGGLTQEQRNAALAQIFGADAMRAANVLFEVGEAGIRKYTAAVDDQGAATDVAAKKMDNLAGDIEKLKGSLETLAIESSGGATSGLRTLVQGADNLVNSLAAIPAPVQNTAVVIAGVAGAALLAAGGAARMKTASASAGEALSELGPRGEKASRGLARAADFAGKAAVALVAMQTATALLGEPVNAQTGKFAKDLEEFARTGKLAGEAARLFGDDLELLKFDMSTLDTGFWTDLGNGVAGFTEGITGLGNVVDESLTKARERTQALDGALTQMVQSGKVDEAQAAFNRIAEAGAKQGISVNELKAAFPGYVAALEGATTAADPVAASQARVQATADAMASSWQGATAKAKGLLEIFDQINGATLSSVDAQIAMEGAIDEATEAIAEQKAAFEENGRIVNANRTELDLNTKAGREVAGSLRNIIDTTIQATQARFDETQSVEEARKVYEKGRQELIRQARQAGLTQAAAERLADQWMSMPKLVNTNVTADTSQADSALTGFTKRVNALDGRTITVRTRITRDGEYIPGSGTQLRRWGGVDYAMAAGGTIEAHFASSPTVLYGERETGGEAFIPKNGDRARSVAIGEIAMGWYGMDVVPRHGRQWVGTPGVGGTSGAGAAAAPVTNNYYWQPQQAVATMADFQGFQQRQDALARVGRPR